MNKRNIIIIVVLIVLVGFVLITKTKSKTWFNDYQNEQRTRMIGFTEETFTYDYSSPEIKKVAAEIRETATGEKDAVIKALQYVEKNIRYSGNYICSDKTKASEDLKNGAGNCVHMSRAAVALLRGIGISTRPVGGCLNARKGTCTPYFAIIPEMPKHPEETYVDANRRGWLHQWIEVWLPDYGWVYADATIAKLYPKTCEMFTVSDNTLSCAEQNPTFVGKCLVS